MKKITALLVTLLIAAITITAQPPQAFKYKAVARDKYGRLIINRKVAMRISILQGSENGAVAYSETHTPFTNLFGVIELEIGNGFPELGTMASIDWGASDYYIRIEMDPIGKSKNEYTVVGTSQLLSVPYALYAGHVQNGSDNDADPLNEVITNAYLSGTILTITEGGATTLIDLSGLQDGTEDADADPANELQNLILDGHELSIEGGNTITLPDAVDDADADPANEIQVLKLEGNMLTLTTNGNPIEIDLAPYLDNTDNQTLLLNNHQLTILNGNTIQLPDSVNDADHDPLNELQELAIYEDKLKLSQGINEVDLSLYLDNTDEQKISLSGNILSLTNGGQVELPVTVYGPNKIYIFSGGCSRMGEVGLDTYCLDTTEFNTIGDYIQIDATGIIKINRSGFYKINCWSVVYSLRNTNYNQIQLFINDILITDNYYNFQGYQVLGIDQIWLFNQGDELRVDFFNKEYSAYLRWSQKNTNSRFQIEYLGQ